MDPGSVLIQTTLLEMCDPTPGVGMPRPSTLFSRPGIKCNMLCIFASFPVVGIGTFHIQSGKSHKRSPFCPMGPRQPAWEVKGSMAEAGKQILLLL